MIYTAFWFLTQGNMKGHQFLDVFSVQIQLSKIIEVIFRK